MKNELTKYKLLLISVLLIGCYRGSEIIRSSDRISVIGENSFFKVRQDGRIALMEFHYINGPDTMVRIACEQQVDSVSFNEKYILLHSSKNRLFKKENGMLTYIKNYNLDTIPPLETFNHLKLRTMTFEEAINSQKIIIK